MMKKTELKDIYDSIQGSRSEIFHLMTQGENFTQFVKNVEDINRLVSIFPEHKEDLFKLVAEKTTFKRLANNISDVREIIAIFPEHKEDFYKLIFTLDNCTRLITHYIDLRSLTIYFREHKEELYQWITHPDNFNRLVIDSNSKTFNSIHVEALGSDFPEHAKDIAVLVMKPQHFMRVVADEALRSEFMQRPLIGAYARGAAVGFFSSREEGELLPPELANHIGSFLDRKSGGQLAQTRQSAARGARLSEAEAEKEEMENILRPQ